MARNKQRRTPTGKLKPKRKKKVRKPFPDINGFGWVTRKIYDAQRVNRAKYRA